jgi:hypothetical protein
VNGALIDSVTTVGAVVVVAMSLFQTLLAMGRPLGHAAFGGEHRVLPKKLRLVSAISAIVFLLALYLILARGGFFGATIKSSSIARGGIWFLVTIFALSTLANLASHSRWERYFMAPIALVLVACCTTLALN